MSPRHGDHIVARFNEVCLKRGTNQAARSQNHNPHDANLADKIE